MYFTLKDFLDRMVIGYSKITVYKKGVGNEYTVMDKNDIDDEEILSAKVISFELYTEYNPDGFGTICIDIEVINHEE